MTKEEKLIKELEELDQQLKEELIKQIQLGEVQEELTRQQKEQYEEIEQQIKKEKLHKKIKDF